MTKTQKLNSSLPCGRAEEGASGQEDNQEHAGGFDIPEIVNCFPT